MRTVSVLSAFGLVFGIAATALAQAEAPAEAPPTDAPAAEAPAAAPAPAASEPVVVSTDGAEPGKFVIGLRLGYMLPMGDLMKDVAMSDGISGAVPIWLDLGYMVTRNIMVGAYGQYAFAFLKNCQAGADCSASGYRLGIQGQYHVSPTEKINPWVGVGLGYENISVSRSMAGQETKGSYSGMEYVNLQAGADFKVSPTVGIGPFLSFSLGQYGSATIESGGSSVSDDIPSDLTAMHEWLTFGVRGAFNL